jgi:hypothetical protein
MMVSILCTLSFGLGLIAGMWHAARLIQRLAWERKLYIEDRQLLIGNANANQPNESR